MPRAPEEPPTVGNGAAERAAKEEPAVADDADVLAVVWARLEPLLPATRRAGRQPVYERREILAAIVYVMQTDCGWKELPSRYPPWKTVHEQFVAWRKAGIWSEIWKGLKPPRPCPLDQLQL